MTIESMGRLLPCPDWLVNVSAIVFDKDGTLTDLNARWAPFFRSAFTNVADGDTRLLAEFEQALGVDGDRLVPNGAAAVSTPAEIMLRAEEVLERAGWPIDSRSDALARGIAAADMGALSPMGDVAGAMAALVAQGVKVAVATSDGRANTTAEILELEIGEFVSALACGDDEVVKPNPEVLLRLAVELDTDPDQMVFVGDSEQDRRTAESAGIRFIEVRASGEDGIAAEFWVRSISEIASALCSDH
jgi:phosphoglycolate phosphatase